MDKLLIAIIFLNIFAWGLLAILKFIGEIWSYFMRGSL